VPKCVHEEFKKRISTKGSYKNNVVLWASNTTKETFFI
jgi:hypothetical protein